MSSLSPHGASTPVEDLHTFQVCMSCAHRAKKSRFSWRGGSWNV